MKRFSFLLLLFCLNLGLQAQDVSGEKIKKAWLDLFELMEYDLEVLRVRAERNEDLGWTYYPTSVYTGNHEVQGRVCYMDNGIRFYENSVESDKEVWVRVLKELNESESYQVFEIYQDNDVFLIRKDRERIGFISFYPDDEQWKLYANLLLDDDLLTDIMETIQIEARSTRFLEESSDSDGADVTASVEEYPYGMDYSYTENIIRKDDEVSMELLIKHYPKDALVYQLERLGLLDDLSVTKELYVDSPEWNAYRYDMDVFILEIGMKNENLSAFECKLYCKKLRK